MACEKFPVADRTRTERPDPTVTRASCIEIRSQDLEVPPAVKHRVKQFKAVLELMSEEDIKTKAIPAQAMSFLFSS